MRLSRPIPIPVGMFPPWRKKAVGSIGKPPEPECGAGVRAGNQIGGGARLFEENGKDRVAAQSSPDFMDRRNRRDAEGLVRSTDDYCGYQTLRTLSEKLRTARVGVPRHG